MTDEGTRLDPSSTWLTFGEELQVMYTDIASTNLASIKFKLPTMAHDYIYTGALKIDIFKD